jgi:hypothetical protein
LSNLNPPKVRLNSQNETATAPNGPCPGPTSEPLRLPSHSLAADAIPHELARPSLPLRRTALDPPRCRPPTQGSRVRFSVARSHVRLRLPSASVVQVVPVTMMHRGILQPRLADGGRLTQSQGWGKRKRHGRARAGPAHQNFLGQENYGAPLPFCSRTFASRKSCWFVQRLGLNGLMSLKVRVSASLEGSFAFPFICEEASLFVRLQLASLSTVQPRYGVPPMLNGRQLRTPVPAT